MRIQEVRIRGLKGSDTSLALSGRDLLHGVNGVGKTRVLQALAYALTGAIPGLARTNDAIMTLAQGDTLSAGMTVETPNGPFQFDRILRRLEDRKGGYKLTEDLVVSPSKGERTPTEKAARVAAELGSLPMMLDFGKFVGLTDAERRKVVSELAQGEAWTRERVRQYLEGTAPGYCTPRERPQVPVILDEVMKAWPAGYSSEAALPLITRAAEEQNTYWRRRASDAEGAVRMAAEVKRRAGDTHRAIQEAESELERLQQDLTTHQADFARDEALAGQAERRRKRLAEVRDQLATLGPVTADTADLDKQMKDLAAQLQEAPDEELAKVQAERDALQSEMDEAVRARVPLAARLQELNGRHANTQSTARHIAAVEGGAEGKARCVIDTRIGCPKDFSGAKEYLQKQMAELEEQADGAQRQISEADKRIEALRQNVTQLEGEARSASNRIREVHEANRRIQDRLLSLERETAQRQQQAAANADRRRLLQEQLQTLERDAAVEAPTLDLTTRRSVIAGMQERSNELKAQLQEKRSAAAALDVQIQAGDDAERFAATHAAADAVRKALGMKGLAGELLKSGLGPIQGEIQNALAAIGFPDYQFFFETSNDRGAEVFRFGWTRPDGVRTYYETLSTGQQILLMVAMLTAIVQRANPPLKLLCLDNVENLDAINREALFRGLQQLGLTWDNIVIAGVLSSTIEAQANGFDCHELRREEASAIA